jgi:hypothetical protein
VGWSTLSSVVLLTLIAATGLSQPKELGLFEDIMPWLPADMEVVYVSNVPVSVSGSRTGLSVIDTYSQLTTVAMAEVTSPDPSNDPMANFEASESLYTGRKFRPLNAPPGMGLKGRFEGCSFFRSSRQTVDRMLSVVEKRHDQFALGPGLYRFTVDGEGSKTAAFAILEPNLVMACSDRSLAEEILARKNKRLPVVAFRDNAPLQRWVNPHAIIWGFRRFIAGTVDPTSPVREASGFVPNYEDPRAIAMTFSLESSSRAKVVYLTGDPSRAPLYELAWGLKVKSVSTSQQRVSEITLQFDPSRDLNDQALGRVMLLVLGMLVIV